MSAPAPVITLRPPAPAVETGVFAGASTARPDSPAPAPRAAGFAAIQLAELVAKPALEVQGGGFGAAEFSRSSGTSGGGARLGVFDARPSLASDGGGRGGPGRVATGAFGDMAAQAPGARPLARQSEAPASEVEILFKPRPMYTDEARRLRIEGTVELEVLFARTGEIRVLAVDRGLGHGLEERAIQAAQGIRFKPAHANGSPVDRTAMVHIVFQLAY